MIVAQPPHRWDISAKEALELQKQLRLLVRQTGTLALDQIRTVAGLDVAYMGREGETKQGKAAVVALSFPELEVIEQVTAVTEVTFPYVPGLLSFREAPALLAALERLETRPDVLVFDGQGYAHPRRFGLASHLGIYLNMPSVGCAKSRLIGSYDEPGPQQGSLSPLLDHGEVIGMVVRSKVRTKPLFISIGHLIDLATAVELVLRCLRGYRMPEPTRLADKLTRHAGVGPSRNESSPGT
jgi:deoxyribonuclease V